MSSALYEPSKKRQQQHSAPNFSMASEAEAVGKEQQHKPGMGMNLSAAQHQNYIRPAFVKSGQVIRFSKDFYAGLSQNQRIGGTVGLFVMLFWPLFGFMMMAPWLLAGAILVYSLLFSFTGFVQDLEESILKEIPLSEQA